MFAIGQCIEGVMSSHGLIISLFLAGMVGGFTHCAGMCAPFVLAQVGGEQRLGRIRSAALLPYHLGRMTTYVALAILVHSVINVAFVFSDMKALIAAPLLMLAGVIFFVTAFPQALAVFPWAGHVRGVVPYKVIFKASAGFMRNPGAFKRYGLGVILGFMPCGMVVAALLASASAASVWEAALAMAAFAGGTVPALVLIALGGGALKRRYPQASARLSQGAMVLSGLWLFALAGYMVF